MSFGSSRGRGKSSHGASERKREWLVSLRRLLSPCVGDSTADDGLRLVLLRWTERVTALGDATTCTSCACATSRQCAQTTRTLSGSPHALCNTGVGTAPDPSQRWPQSKSVSRTGQNVRPFGVRWYSCRGRVRGKFYVPVGDTDSPRPSPSYVAQDASAVAGLRHSRQLLHGSRQRLYLAAPGAGQRGSADGSRLLSGRHAARTGTDRAVFPHREPTLSLHPSRLRPRG